MIVVISAVKTYHMIQHSTSLMASLDDIQP